MLNTPQQRHRASKLEQKGFGTETETPTETEAETETETATETPTAAETATAEAAYRTKATVAHDDKVRQGKASLRRLKAPKSPIKASKAY